MKKMSLTIACLLLTFSAFASPGVVIEAKGKVTIEQGGKSTTAQTGAQFSDGATINVASGGSATLMFNNGATKKLGSNEKFTAVKSAPGQSSGKPIIKGIAMAYNDATSSSKGPTVHAMVKEVAGGPVSSADNKQLDPARAKEMASDLNQISSLGLDNDGKALMQAQVYYKYGQNQKMVDTLLPVYKKQDPPTEMVKNLLSLGYQRMGKPDEAAKYR